MKVKELIKKLVEFEMEADVLISVQGYHSSVDLENVHAEEPDGYFYYVILTPEKINEDEMDWALRLAEEKEQQETNKKIKVQSLPDGRLDSKNAAQYLGLGEKTLAMMRCKGTGPKFIKRGRIFYFKNDLDEWLKKSGSCTTTEQARYRLKLS